MWRLATVACAACTSMPRQELPPDGPPLVASELDILFVWGNEASSLDTAKAVSLAMPAFVAGLPGETDVHVGVVTSNMGTSTPGGLGPDVGTGRYGCSGVGDDGALMHGFATLDRDYLTTLDASVMTQMLYSNHEGCGFTQSIHAAVRALEPERNPGFRRPEARLAVIFFGEKDDCSPSTPDIFGVPDSFECIERGVACDQPMAEYGSKTNCHAVSGSPDFADLATFLPSFPIDRTVVGAIIGPATPMNVVPVAAQGMTETRPVLGHSCQWDTDAGANVASPAIRLEELADRFPHHRVERDCAVDLTPQLTAIAHAIADARRP
jgi:hypothetical protein